MQTVGAIIANPTGDPVVTGSQLNSVKHGGKMDFAKLLGNTIGNALGKGLSKPQGNGMCEGTDSKMDGLEGKLAALIEQLNTTLDSLKEEMARSGVGQGLQEADYKEILLILSEMCEGLGQLLQSLPQQFAQLEQFSAVERLFQDAANPTNPAFRDGLLQLLTTLKSTMTELKGIVSDSVAAGVVKETLAELNLTLKQLTEVLAESRVVKGQEDSTSPVAKVNKESPAKTDSGATDGNLKIEVRTDVAEKVAGKVTDKIDETLAKLNNLVEKLGKVVEKFSGQTAKSENFGLGERLETGTGLPSALANGHPVSHNQTVQNLPGFTRMAETIRVFQSVMESISAKAKLVQTPEQSQFTIQLQPASLGKLQMKITAENGLITAKIAAETQQVKELLESNLNNLRQSLAEQGIKVDQLEVGLSSNREFQMFDRGMSQWNQPQSKKSSVNGTEVSAAQAERLVARGYITGDSTIDYTV